MVPISQSLINDINECPRYLKFKYVDKKDTEPSELMLKGQFFEQGLIGANRSHTPVVLPKLKNGGPSQGEKDLLELIEQSKKVLENLGVQVAGADIQGEVAWQCPVTKLSMICHTDMITNDFEGHGKAIYDVKYTETRYDDRWEGWADIEKRGDAQIQAITYVKMVRDLTGHIIPFYFLIFGKAGWVRVYKIIVTEDALANYEEMLRRVEVIMKTHETIGYTPNPSYERCRSCRFADICDSRQTKPDIELVYL